MKDNSYEVVSDFANEEEVYSSLNEDNGRHPKPSGSKKQSPQSMLGPLPVPPKALPKKPCECANKESVCDIEGGIKFNPCYMSKPDLSNDLCDVMLDAVWQAGHAAAVHAGRAKCMHCAHFTSKFNAEMKDIMQQTNYNKPKRVCIKRTWIFMVIKIFLNFRIPMICLKEAGLTLHMGILEALLASFLLFLVLTTTWHCLCTKGTHRSTKTRLNDTSNF